MIQVEHKRRGSEAIRLSPAWLTPRSRLCLALSASPLDASAAIACIISLLLFLDLDDLVRLQVVFLEVLLLRHSVLVELALPFAILGTAVRRDGLLNVPVCAHPDQHLVAVGDFDLSVFERHRDATSVVLLLLEHLNLLRLVVVVVDVVRKRALEAVHLSNDFVVLLTDVQIRI